MVAPRVGAWIETGTIKIEDLKEGSHPVWVRGLKQKYCPLLSMVVVSHPVWVRGLKLLLSCEILVT